MNCLLRFALHHIKAARAEERGLGFAAVAGKVIQENSRASQFAVEQASQAGQSRA